MVPMIVELIAVGDVKREILDKLRQKIEWTFVPLIDGGAVGQPMEMPAGALNQDRKQYNADIILAKVLERTTGDNKVLTVLDVDLYTPVQNLNFIFGQAQLRGRVAMVSMRRLDPRFYNKGGDGELLFNRLVKEAIHELGHTFGLIHCPNAGCVMSFSNSVSDVDEKTATLCKLCRTKIQTTATIRIVR